MNQKEKLSTGDRMQKLGRMQSSANTKMKSLDSLVRQAHYKLRSGW